MSQTHGALKRIFDKLKCKNHRLRMAARRGDVQAVEKLLAQEADINALNLHFDTPLIIAATHGQAKTVERLLERGADVSRSGENGYTALIAASMQGSAGIVKILLEHGADASFRGARRFYSMVPHTPLEWARLKGHGEVAEILEAHDREKRQAPAPVKRPDGFHL